MIPAKMVVLVLILPEAIRVIVLMVTREITVRRVRSVLLFRKYFKMYQNPKPIYLIYNFLQVLKDILRIRAYYHAIV